MNNNNDDSGEHGASLLHSKPNAEKAGAGEQPAGDVATDTSVFACPRCGAPKVAKSRAVGYDHLLMRFMPMRPYRCLRCYHRFWNREGFFDDQRRVKTWIYVLLAVALFFFARMLLEPSASVESSSQSRQSTQAIGIAGPVTKIPARPAQVPVKTSQPASAAKVLQPKDTLTPGAKRDIIESHEFNQPQVLDQRLPVISSDELRRRLAEAKVKAENAELAKQQKQQLLKNEVGTESAEAHSLLKMDINYRIEQWKRAWEDGDAERYLEFYAKDFVPPNPLTRQQWRSMRLARVAPERNIKLRLSGFDVEFSDNNTRTRVTFSQRYQSNSFTENSRKELLFRKLGDRWFIVSERELGN